MSDVLVVIDSLHPEEPLLAEIERRHPTRVTLLMQTGRSSVREDAAAAREHRDVLAALVARIESRTGARVAGLVENREQLRGWRFDRTIEPRPARPEPIAPTAAIGLSAFRARRGTGRRPAVPGSPAPGRGT